MKQIFRIFSIIIGIGVCLWGIFILLKPNKNSKKIFPKLSITQNHFKINLAEKNRIIKIITNNQDKTFGIDLSHYQEKQHINWKKISLTDQKLPIDFILLRATMGTNKTIFGRHLVSITRFVEHIISITPTKPPLYKLKIS